MSFTSETIERNLSSLHDEIRSACATAGRDPSSVKLVAVTKYADWQWVEALADLHPIFGENRPQQLAERQPQIPSAEWHLIGQLQRNKVRTALQHAAQIHSVDSTRLLQKISSVAAELNQVPNVLLQVNVTGESSKSGFSPDELRKHWTAISQTPSVRISGLMTMATASGSQDETRSAFRNLSHLRQELSSMQEADEHLSLNELSMGMSGDFSIAIEEGATIVRIGSRLYTDLERSKDSPQRVQ